MSDNTVTVKVENIPTALQIAAELGLTHDNELRCVADAWVKLSPGNKKYISGVLKGMIIGMAESPVNYGRERV